MTKYVKCIRDFPIGVFEDYIATGNEGAITSYRDSSTFVTKKGETCTISHKIHSHFFEVIDNVWVPKKGDKFWCIGLCGDLLVCFFSDGWKYTLDYGNYFQTEEEAKRAVILVKEALKKAKNE